MQRPIAKWMHVLCVALMLVLLPIREAPAGSRLVIGVATGFPPYQFEENGQPVGFDVDMARAMAERLHMTPVFYQDAWDTVLNQLRLKHIDCIAGMEINPFRAALFNLSDAYTLRHDVLFVREDSPFRRVEELYGQVLTGDRHSFIELLWKHEGNHTRFRIMQTRTKEEAMHLLKEKTIKGAIMPFQVGRYLAQRADVEVRVLFSPDPGSPVGFATSKGHEDLLHRINAELKEMRRSGELTGLHHKWFGRPRP